MGMIDAATSCARQGGGLEAGRIDRVLARVRQGLDEGTCLAIVSRFAVTATA